MKYDLWSSKLISDTMYKFLVNKLLNISITFLRKYAYAITLALCGSVVVISGITYSYKNTDKIVPQVLPLSTAAPFSDKVALSIHTVNESNAQITDSTDTYDETFLSLSLPVNGVITNKFASSSLLFSKSLQQYRIHAGIDFAGNLGELVVAAADGIVANIWRDVVYGNTIEIVHADGSIARYANLGTLEMVNTGMNIYAGDAISTIGNSAAIEFSDSPHLHFELIVDGEPIQPHFVA